MRESLLLFMGTLLAEKNGKRYTLWTDGTIHVFPACGRHFNIEDINLELHDLACRDCRP